MIGVPSKADVAPATALPSRDTYRASVFVWSVWALLLLAALGCVGIYGHNVPVYDEFDVVPHVSSDISTIPSWLWEQYNEHRAPLPKLILIALVRSSGRDLRSGMVFNVSAMAFLALAMIWVAKRIRGWTSCTDAFFPLMLLHFGHSESFLWGWQVIEIAPTLLAGILLMLLVLRTSQLTHGMAVLTSLCLVLLSLSGPIGMVYVPFFGLELITTELLLWGPGRKGRSVFTLLLALTALLLLGLCFIGYESPHMPPSPGLRASLRTSAQFLSMSFGFQARALWPFSALVMLILALAGTALLVIAWYKQPQVRSRVLGQLVFLASTMVLAASVGWGRAGFGYSAGFAMRYVSLLAPFLCCVYCIWEMHTPFSLGWTRLGRLGLLSLAGLMFLLNVPGGLRYARAKAQKMEALERDVREGVPAYILVYRYAPFIHYSQEWTAQGLQMLQQAGIEPFTHLREDPPLAEIPVDTKPSETNQIVWTDGMGQGSGENSYLLYSLPRPIFVAAIRITYSLTNREGVPAHFEMNWTSSARGNLDEGRGYETTFMETGSGEHSATIYVCDTISQIRVSPDNRPFTFRISSMILLVPEENRR